MRGDFKGPPLRRYPLLEAGHGDLARHTIRRRSSSSSNYHNDNVTNCTKTWVIFSILVSLGIFIYLPFLNLGARKPIAFVWPSNQSRDINVLIRPNVTTTRLWPSSVCSRPKAKTKDDPDIYLLVVVCSALQNFVERQYIRDSWAQESLANVKVVFLLGQTINETSPLQANVSRESEEHGDILQEGFIDNYANLTVKSLMLLKWYVSNCQKVPYVLKTDDDVYINMGQLFKLVMANKKPIMLTGTLICGAVPIRDPYNKWYSPSYMFGGKVYPNYLSGTAYLMSRSAASVLYDVAMYTPAFHLEDIFITGILAEAAGIKPQDHVGFSYVKRRANTCLYAQTISSHHLTGNEMRDMYAKVSAKNLKCVHIKTKFLRNYGPGKCRWKKTRR